MIYKIIKLQKTFFHKTKNDFNLIQNEINNNINQTTQSQNKKIAINISGGLDSNVILYETLKYKKFKTFCL